MHPRILSASLAASAGAEVSAPAFPVDGRRPIEREPGVLSIFAASPPETSRAEFLDRHVPRRRRHVSRELQLRAFPGRAQPTPSPPPPPPPPPSYRRDDDAQWRWVEVVGRFLFDEGSTPSHLIGVITDITERRGMEDSLRRMAEDLSDADHRKDEFLATLAHELRNPLAPIRNGIELLKRAAGSNAQTQSVVGVMERQMGHLVRLVDDLIDVSRITRNAVAAPASIERRAWSPRRSLRAARRQGPSLACRSVVAVHVDADPPAGSVLTT